MARRARFALGLAGLAGALSGTARGETTFYQARIAPIMDRHCVVCHGPEKQKAKLRVDTFEWLMKGAESGEVIKPGDVKGSELYRRITLPASEEEVMPSDGKPLLTRDEIKNIELWIAGGASPTKGMADFAGAPPLGRLKTAEAPLTADWRPRAAEIAKLEQALGVRLVARSQVPTDGLVLRTASAPGRCGDETLKKLAPVAPLIVEAELARTKVADAGLASLASWENLRSLDLTGTAITSRGVASLGTLKRLEVLNLTDTAVDDAGVAAVKVLPAMRQLWTFGTKVAPAVTGGAEAK